MRGHTTARIPTTFVSNPLRRGSKAALDLDGKAVPSFGDDLPFPAFMLACATIARRVSQSCEITSHRYRPPSDVMTITSQIVS